MPICVLLALIVHDTYFYWMHRTVHHPKLYKAVHLVHHQSVNPSPWASFSFHFFEGILEAMIAPILLFLIPMHPLALLLFSLASFAINVYGHLGFEIAPKWFRRSFLFEILNTSVHHNLHHEKFKGNYGLYFRVWDRLMGTEHPDYVKNFDLIQERRFGPHVSTPTFSSKIIGPLIILFVLGAFSLNAQSAIEGTWRDTEGGGVILIYEEEGKYFGKVVSSDKPEENEKIKGKTIFILKDFEQKNEKKFCCGSIFLPRYKKLAAGTLVLVDEETLKVKGKYGWISKSRIWKKV